LHDGQVIEHVVQTAVVRQPIQKRASCTPTAYSVV
jgi:hypothetical protein